MSDDEALTAAAMKKTAAGLDLPTEFTYSLENDTDGNPVLVGPDGPHLDDRTWAEKRDSDGNLIGYITEQS